MQRLKDRKLKRYTVPEKGRSRETGRDGMSENKREQVSKR